MTCQYFQTASTIDFSVSLVKSTVVATYNFYVKITANGGSIGWASDILSSELFTLNVMCGPLTPITFTQDPSFITSKNVILDDSNSNIYQFFPPSTGSIICPVTSISLTGVTSSSTTIIAQQPASCVQPCTQVDLSATNLLSTITFQFTTLFQGGQQHVSNVVTVNIICGIASTTISQFIPAGSIVNINLGESSPNNRFYFNKFDCSNPICCQNGLTYTASPTASLAAPTQHPSFSVVQWDPVLSLYYIEADTSAVNTFDVYIHAQNEFLTAIVSPMVRVNIILCGPGSTIVTEGDFTNGKTALQIVEHNSATMTRFYLPIFTVNNPNCPITNYLSSASNLIYEPLNSGFVNDGQETSLGSGEFIVSPHDITIHSEYLFFIKAISLSSDFIFSKQYTLIVGFTKSAKITQSEQFVTKREYKASDSDIIYSLHDPQIDRPFCSILSHSITNLQIKNQPELQAKDIKFICTSQPCNKIKVENNGKAAYINFNIETKFDGELTFKSQMIELLIIDDTKYPLNYERHQDLLQFQNQVLCDVETSSTLKELRKKINIEQNIAGQIISVKSNDFMANDMQLMPYIGNQIIKFDKEKQLIRVSEYDSEFEGTYNLNLKIQCKEGGNMTLKFQASFQERRKFETQFQTINPVSNKTSKPYFMQVQNYTGRIQKIDIYGNVTVLFTESINYLNHSLINETLRLYIQPAPLTIDVLQEQDPNATFIEIEGRFLLESSDLLNFTWYVENQTEISSYLMIKLDFKNKLQVSAHDIIRDKLVIYILDPELLRSKKMSYLKNRIMIKSLPKQMNDKIFEVVSLKSTGNFMNIVGIISCSTLAVNWLMQMMMSNIAGVFHNLQLLLYQTLINIQFPANVMFFLYFIKLIINSELLDPGIITEQVFQFEGDEEIMNYIDNNQDNNHLLNDHFMEMGFETFNAIQNIGGIIFALCYFLILVIFGILTFILLKSCDCLFPKFRKTVKKIEQEEKQSIEEKIQNDPQRMRQIEEPAQLEGGSEERVIQLKNNLALRSYIMLSQKHADVKQQIMFSFIFTVVTENIFTFVVAGILWLNKNQVRSRLETFNFYIEESIFDIVGASLLVLSALVVITKMILSVYALYSLASDQKNEVLFEQLLKRINIDNSFELLYYLWFNIRRILICIIALYLQDFTGIQIVIFMFLNILSTIYIAILRPFKQGYLNRNEIISETTTSFASIIHCSFTQFNPDPITQYYTGWLYIGMIILIVFYFQYFHLRDSVRFVRLRLKRCKNQSQRKKKIPQYIQAIKEVVQTVEIINNEMLEIKDPVEQNEQNLGVIQSQNNITFGENQIELKTQDKDNNIQIVQNPRVRSLGESSLIKDEIQSQQNNEIDDDIESILQEYEQELSEMVTSYFKSQRKWVMDKVRQQNYNDQGIKLFEFEKVRLSFEQKAFVYYQEKYNQFLIENLFLQLNQEIDSVIQNQKGINIQLDQEILKQKILSHKSREPQAIQFIDLVYSDELIENHRDKDFTESDYIRIEVKDMSFNYSFFEIKTLISKNKPERIEAMKELAKKYKTKQQYIEELAERYAIIQYFYHSKKPKKLNKLNQLFEEELMQLIASKVSQYYRVIVQDNSLSQQVKIHEQKKKMSQEIQEYKNRQKYQSEILKPKLQSTQEAYAAQLKQENQSQNIFAHKQGKSFEQQNKNNSNRNSVSKQTQNQNSQPFGNGANIFLDEEKYRRKKSEEISESSNEWN